MNFENSRPHKTISFMLKLASHMGRLVQQSIHAGGREGMLHTKLNLVISVS